MQYEKSSSFLVIAAITLIVATAGLAFSWPFISTKTQAYADQQAHRLIANATGRTPAEAAVNYRLASWLQPSNSSPRLKLARLQVASGQADAALKTLEKAGQGREAVELQLRILLEQGRTSEAANKAGSLTVETIDLRLIASAYMLAERPSEVTSLSAKIPEELKPAITRIQIGGLPLAQELYANQLPQSSQRVLMKQAASFEQSFLLGQISYDYHSPTALVAATKSLLQAIEFNPASIEARELLSRIYADRDMPTESATQAQIAEKLRAGKL